LFFNNKLYIIIVNLIIIFWFNNMASISNLVITDPKVYTTFSAKRQGSCGETLGRIVFAPFALARGAIGLCKTVLQSAFQPYVYHASSEKYRMKLDADRLEKSREDLRAIGGQTVALQTVDGDWIEAMYFDVNDFKSAMVGHGGRFVVDPSGKQFLRSYSDELTTLLRKNLKLEGKYVKDEAVPDDLVFQVELPSSAPGDPLVGKKQVMILTQGNGGIFEKDRTTVAQTLFKGQSCMVFNVRGTGRSHGKPNEERSYRDIEAVYQFLRSKGFNPEEMCVNGYCLGAGLAVDLASRHPVHLILDRPFARIGDVMADIARDFVMERIKVDPENWCVQKIGDLTSDVVASVIDRCVISYNNQSKLPRVQGSILFVHSDQDEVIPLRSRNRMEEAVRACPNATIQTSDEFEHNDPWDEETEEIYQDHLRKHGMVRRYPNTAIPPSISLARLNRAPLLPKMALRALVLGASGAVASGPQGAVVTMLVGEGLAAGYKKRNKLAKQSRDPDR
jgi:pimeloyl-ACP methyl ester carboxylesterase